MYCQSFRSNQNAQQRYPQKSHHCRRPKRLRHGSKKRARLIIEVLNIKTRQRQMVIQPPRATEPIHSTHPRAHRLKTSNPANRASRKQKKSRTKTSPLRMSDSFLQKPRWQIQKLSNSPTRTKNLALTETIAFPDQHQHLNSPLSLSSD